MVTKVGKSILGRLFLILALLVMEMGVMPAQAAFAAPVTVTNNNDSGPDSLRTIVYSDGKVVTDSGSEVDGRAVAVQPDGLISMSYEGSNVDFALTRYIGNASPSTPSFTTIIGDSPDPSYRNGLFTIAVQVTGDSTPPSGTVNITGDENGVGCTITLSNGTGSCDLLFSTVGPKVLTAIYNGDDVYLPSSDTEDHVVVIPPSANGVRYVKWNAGGANNGTSWTDAYTSLQSALADASSGDQIWVAAGTYMPTTGNDRSISFNLKNGVAVYGGFAGAETVLAQRNPAANPTVLSGDIGTQTITSDNSYHVVVGSGTNNTAILDGFTVTGGNANGSSPNDQGGGMYIYQGSPVIGNATFVNNSATFGGGMYNGGDSGSPTSGSSPVLTNVIFNSNSANEGGGMENQFYSSPALTNVTFSNNTAVRSGGGMLNFEQSKPSLTDVMFAGNTAAGGGGMSNWGGSHPTLERVTFAGNSAGNGGGMANDTSGPSLHNVVFENNTVTDYGGGMSNDNQSSPTLMNVTFSGNKAYHASADTYGGGMTNVQSSPTLTNVTFYNNSATHGGGLLNRDGGSAPILTNVTFSANTAAVEGGAIADDSNMIVRNGIFWGNNGGEIFTLGLNGHPSVTYSIVEGGFTGAGNLNLDPLLGPLTNHGGFTKTMAIDANSPAVDAGDDAHCPSPDQRGVTRPQRTHCDMGAYEYEDLTPPRVLSIVRENPNPTSASTVSFTVTFSENVINVGAGDFFLTTTGLSGTGITNITGSGASYTVTVNTGSGNGTIRLDLVDDDNIKDLANLPLGGVGPGNGDFTGGQVYDILWISVAGNAGAAGATLSYEDGTQKTATADGNGDYSFLVPYHWSGTVTPSKTGYTFSPASKTYSDLTANHTLENYTATEIIYVISGNAGVAGAILSYTDGTLKTATADDSGYYSFSVSYDWAGTVTPSKTGYTFLPGSKTYSNVKADQTAQNYTATLITYVISGNAGVAGAILDYTDGSAKTATADGYGNYSFSVPYGWSGTVTPSKAGYDFSPPSKTYSTVTADKPAQNYTATPITYVISGNAGVAGAVLSYTDGVSKTATTDGSGNYSFSVSYNWSGTVIPSKAGYTFVPASRTYSNVLTNKTAQNYAAYPPPSAQFDAWPTNLNAGQTVEFHMVNTTNITSCSWDYGDGSAPGTACSPYHSHTYAAPGFYTVSLTVGGPGGSSSLTRTRYISVFPTLVVNKTGDGNGTITSSPDGINCGSGCSGNFIYQSVVKLTAVPAPGSLFVGWSGGGCSGTGACTVTVETAVTVTAHFESIVAICPSITGWKGEYWVNTSLSGLPVVCRDDASLTFDWGSGSPDPSIPVDKFSARWTRTINLSNGTYLFHIDHDDGARLFIDDMVNPVLDKWSGCCVVDTSAPITLSDGDHVIRMEYYEDGGAANARLWWEKVSPDVLSVTRADPDPTSASSIHFNVTFSESVTNVDASDFSVITSGITGASITGVSGSGTVRTVTVKTGTGNGTIRLDVLDNDSILNGGGFPLGGVGSGNGSYTSGQVYTVRKAPTFADVPTSHVYYRDIETLYANGYTAGCASNPLRFCPDQTMNRGEAAVFIMRGTRGASYVPPAATHYFKDDWSKNPWAEPWSEAMRNNNISAGCQTLPVLKYCPWDKIPREQAVVFVVRLKYGTDYRPPAATGTVFADMTDVNSLYTAWAEQAYKDGLIPKCGTASNSKPMICPKALVTRGLAAYMIVRAKGLTMP